MTVVAAEAVPEDDEPLPAPPEASFVDLLVARVSREYGVDPEGVRDRAAAALAAFAGARVQTFVPILVEKRLRASYRGCR
ncbi:three-helix bundle dimerization domain-containing protein [Geodermatophilus ruber]|uniref:Uncharacterized protein n=1 Tax=Geodermatophilus ruber TaxID=504800 RepID=A0A1I4BLM4_9ACTN|nr:hypothetical protein [Geodermatophilus ruber]SFK69087.1 hypothetical protein SAMN04488085_10378 [Geodermatophilus ruber]